MRIVGAVLLTLVGLTGCAPATVPTAPAAAHAKATQVRLPTPNAPWDYQIGASYTPARGVTTVVRDRRAKPAGRGYDICYVNAFQTQPDERGFWRGDRSKLILRHRGRAVVDGAWGEFLLDTRTPAHRRRLAAIVGRWIAGCAKSGYDAVELDNLDSWSRSHRSISPAHNKAFAKLLTSRAHRSGLAVAQKNWAELTGGRALGFDFAVAEECGRWQECGSYARAYGDRVLAVEYRATDFRAACKAWGPRLSVVLRDVAVSARGPNRRC